MSLKDRKERFKFVRKCQNLLKTQPNFFFLEHKILLRWCFVCVQNKPLCRVYETKGHAFGERETRAWRLQPRALKTFQVHGKRLNLMVAIAKSEGVILAEEYEKLNSEFFLGVQPTAL